MKGFHHALGEFASVNLLSSWFEDGNCTGLLQKESRKELKVWIYKIGHFQYFVFINHQLRTAWGEKSGCTREGESLIVRSS